MRNAFYLSFDGIQLLMLVYVWKPSQNFSFIGSKFPKHSYSRIRNFGAINDFLTTRRIIVASIEQERTWACRRAIPATPVILSCPIWIEQEQSYHAEERFVASFSHFYGLRDSRAEQGWASVLLASLSWAEHSLPSQASWGLAQPWLLCVARLSGLRLD